MKKISFIAIALIFSLLFTGFVNIEKAGAAYNYSPISNYESSPTVALAGTQTIQSTWSLNFTKIALDILKWESAKVLVNPNVEVKFLVTIDGKALNTKKSDVVDGTKAGAGQNAPNLNTYSTPYSDQSYKSFNGGVTESNPNQNEPFKIYASYTDYKAFAFTMIDNQTIPIIDGGNSKAHFYTYQALIRINSEEVLVLPAVSGTFTPGGATAKVTHTAAWYRENYFDGATNFFVGVGGASMSPNNGTNAIIHIPGWSGNGKSRPALDFKLTYIIPYGDLVTRTENELIFVAQNDNASNLAIMVNDGEWSVTSVKGCDGNISYPFAALTVVPGTGGSKPAVDWDTGINADFFFAGPSLPDHPSEKPAGNVYYTFLNKIYTGGDFGPGKCPSSGNLTDEAKNLGATDANNTSGTQNFQSSTICDGITGNGMVGDALYKAFCSLGVALAKWADSMLDNAFCYLQESLGYTNSKSANWSACNIDTSPGSTSGFGTGSSGGTGSGGGGGGGGW